jgi:hypothetical protein
MSYKSRTVLFQGRLYKISKLNPSSKNSKRVSYTSSVWVNLFLYLLLLRTYYINNYTAFS